jgi:4'-phosphopantetheinyl transferase EntD
VGLNDVLIALAPPEISLAAERIGRVDPSRLHPDETAYLTSLHPRCRGDSAAARVAAAALLEQAGVAGAPVLPGASGAPVWPAGFVGSLAHDGEVALAALARSVEVVAVGIDVEAAEPLAADMIDLVASRDERTRRSPHPLWFKALFCAKEAIYKAHQTLQPERFLEFSDVAVDLDAGTGRVLPDGPTFEVRVAIYPRIIALAYLPRRTDPSCTEPMLPRAVDTAPVKAPS